MIYTLLLCLTVLLAIIGLAAVCYFILLTLNKPERKRNSIIILPLDKDDRENAGSIGYTIERLELFGEDKNVKILAVDKDDNEHKELEEMFRRYNIVKFASLGDMPVIMSCLWDD